MTSSPRRKGLSLAVLLLVFLLVFPLSILFMNAHKTGCRAFDRQAERVLDRSAQMGEQARHFDQARALGALPPGGRNGFVYRFDDHLPQAALRQEGPTAGGTGPGHRPVVFEFDDPDRLPLRPPQDGFVVEEGVLRYEHSPQNLLQSRGGLEIPREGIGEVEVRLKAGKSRKFLLSWSEKPDVEALDPHDTSYLAIDTLPDGRFHTYRMDVSNVLKGIAREGRPIRKLYLFPSDTVRDQVEIDFLRFLPKREKYAGQPAGLTYEIKGGQTRRAVYVHQGVELAFDLALPEGGPKLRFGLGVLEPGAPVPFQIRVRGEKGEETALFSEKVADPDAWRDAGLDLAPYAGQRVRITAAAGGAGDNVLFWTGPLVYTPPERRFNVIVVLEDALRADRLSCYGYPHPTTPVKAALAPKGIVFSHAYAQATNTRPSCASFMTSMYPSQTGVWNTTDILPESYLTLAEILRSQGYATASFTQNINAGANAGLHQGFGTVFDHDVTGSRPQDVYGNPALRQWLEANRDRNVFVYLHVMDPHAPYDPPGPWVARYRKPFLGGEHKVPKDPQYDPAWLETPTVESRNFLYDEEVRHNDFQFEGFLKMLDEMGLAGNTLLVFLADHGEHLGENGLWDHTPPGTTDVLHVPLILVCPGTLPGGRTVGQPVQLLDLLPTVLDLAGVPRDGLLLAGDSLLPLINGEKTGDWDDRFCVSEEVRMKEKDDPGAYGSIFYRDFHVLHSDRLMDGLAAKARDGGGWLLRCLPDTRVFDSGETLSEFYSVPLLVDPFFNARVKRFMERLRAENLETWRALSRNTAAREEPPGVDPAAVRKLRSLGYIQ